MNEPDYSDEEYRQFAQQLYNQGAHDAIERMIELLKIFKAKPISASIYSFVRLRETYGEQYISVSNMIRLLEHHRDGQKHGTQLPGTEGRGLIGRDDQ